MQEKLENDNSDSHQLKIIYLKIGQSKNVQNYTDFDITLEL